MTLFLTSSRLSQPMAGSMPPTSGVQHGAALVPHQLRALFGGEHVPLPAGRQPGHVVGVAPR